MPSDTGPRRCVIVASVGSHHRLTVAPDATSGAIAAAAAAAAATAAAAAAASAAERLPGSAKTMPHWPRTP